MRVIQPSPGAPGRSTCSRFCMKALGATCGTRRAFAFVADVRANASDAVRIELEHQEGAAIVVLVPYSRNRLDREVTFGQISGTAGQSKVWRQR